jgi:methyl-accepting chemotaxis protein/HAMP domain-containing protein
MSEPLVQSAALRRVRNGIFWRMLAVTVPGAMVLATVMSLAAGLSGRDVLQSVLVVAPLLYLVGGGAFEYILLGVLLRKASEPAQAGEASRLQRLLELPRRIELVIFTSGWIVGGALYAAVTVLVYHGSPWVLALGPAVGLFAALFLGAVLTQQVELALQGLAVAEFRRDPTVVLPRRGIYWIRQRWYLPYTFAVALLSMFFFGGAVLAIQYRRVMSVLLQDLRAQGARNALSVITQELDRLAFSSIAPVAGIALGLLVVFGLVGIRLARRQARATIAVESALRAVVAGRHEPPEWISTDETGDLAIAAGEISTEMQLVFGQLKLMATGDLSRQLSGDSGLVQAFRDSQSAMMELAKMMVALSRGETTQNGRIAGDLGGHFDRLLAAFQAIVEQAQTVAQGDLRQNVDIPGALGQAMQQMTLNLRAMVGQTQRVSGDIGEIVVSLQTAATQLSTATTEQVAAVTETANTMTEMAQTSAVSADRAAELIKRGEAATQVVEAGGETSESAVASMTAIARSLADVSGASIALADGMRRIDGIVETVGFLANQSSTLAINAGIEAARAGEAGKGFSLVAREIRTLAGDSRKAASEIRALLAEIGERTALVDDSINDGMRTVEEGGRLVERLGQVVSELGVTVRDAVGLMRQVEGSARQHRAGVGQVSQALGNMQKASESIRDGARVLGQLSTRANELSSKLQLSAGSYTLPVDPPPAGTLH